MKPNITTDAPGSIPTTQQTAQTVGMHPGASLTQPCEHPISGLKSSSQWLPKRKNLRAEFHDYSGGIYFITICTRDKRHYFGEIIDGEMKQTVIGRYAVRCLKELHTHYTYVIVPQYVVMPNHVHALIVIRERADAPGSIPTVRTLLGVVVGGFKQSVTRYARRNSIEFGWQSRFHDHIIRDSFDGNKISEYITNNIARWDIDRFNDKQD